MIKLTEKGNTAFNFAIKYFKDRIFSAKDLSQISGQNFTASTLNALVKRGLLIKKDTKPVTYKLVEKAEKILELNQEIKEHGNSNLQRAKDSKRDEFYTRYEDIETECNRYKEYFINKIIYLNCDDSPEKSNFFKFFVNNFDNLSLKKLIATHFDDKNPSYGHMLYRDNNCDGFIDVEDIEYFPLKGNGDFRSPECIQILKESDIVITNPPFSLFREFIDQLMEYNKKFLVIGNENAITYKNIFSYIKDNRIWEGYNSPRPKEFFISEDYEIKNLGIDKTTGKRTAKFGNTLWFTNFPTKKREEELILTATYYDDKNKREEYPYYDNYAAININRVKNIPKDYFGVMGVPITFLAYYNPNQFILLGDSRYHDGNNSADDINFINGKQLFKRLLIKRKF